MIFGNASYTHTQFLSFNLLGAKFVSYYTRYFEQAFLKDNVINAIESAGYGFKKALADAKRPNADVARG